MYTVKQLADLAGVSVRTLHYYDEIDLLNPSSVGDNGYRYYADDTIFRLQQILFYRELNLTLDEIKAILDEPGFDVIAALQTHREGLEARIQRLTALINTIDTTIMHLAGEVDMSNQQVFAGFDPEDEERYKEEAREAYGSQEVDASYKRWNSYSQQQRDKIMAEGNAIYNDLADLVGQEPAAAEVQHVIERWHQHLRYFYEPSVARLRGLAQLYVDSPDFARKFQELHPDLPAFMQEAINIYCDELAES